MEKCPANRNETVERYLSGELSEKDTLEFEAHYLACDACHEALKIWQDTVNLIKREGPAALPKAAAWAARKRKPLFPWQNVIDKLSHWPSRWAYGNAAIVALLLLLLAGSPFIYLAYKDKPQPAPLSAENFYPNTFLENLKEQVLRADFRVIEALPQDDADLKDEIFFKWQALKDGRPYAGPFSFKILNNKREELYEFEVDENHYRLNTDLAPGLYYWALLTEDEFVYIGRFYVGR